MSTLQQRSPRGGAACAEAEGRDDDDVEVDAAVAVAAEGFSTRGRFVPRDADAIAALAAFALFKH